MSLWPWALGVLPLGTLAMTVLNVATWRRGTETAAFRGRVSVVVPARNEGRRIGACLEALGRSRHPIHEILVYDDESTDDTRAVVSEVARRDPRIRLVGTEPLPQGWVGKVHACERLARASTGDIVLAVDADVRVLPGGIARIASLLEEDGCDVLTAVPRQTLGGAVERALMPLLLLTYLSWLPLELVARTRDPRVVAANGQLLAVRRSALEALGYFRPVASEIVDDVAFARAAKAAGLRVAFADGTEMATCRMYESGGALWEGFSKNIAEGLGGPVGVVAAVALYALTFLAPWVALPTSLALADGSAMLHAAAAGVAANVLQRVILAVRYAQPLGSIAVHPIAIGALIILTLRSLVWVLRGRVRWSGRVYAARAARRVTT